MPRPRTIARMPRTNTAAARRFAATVAASRVDVCQAILSGRRFGVEIEFVGLDRSEAIRIIRALPGIQCRENDEYNHQNSSSHWKVTTDSSVSVIPGQNYNNCGEVVSPILSGENGLEQVRKVVKALANAGATANRSCGLHVHVDTAGLNANQFENIIHRYGRNEDQIDAFMPASRRRSSNQFCRSVNGLRPYHGRIGGFVSLADVASAYGERYQKVNVTSYSRHRTVEFRHHSGSVNADKVCNWIQFCVNFVNTTADLTAGGMVRLAARRLPGATRGGAVARGARVSKTLLKMAAIGRKLEGANRYYGVTAEELRMACVTEVGATSLTSVVVMVSNLRRQFGWVVVKRRGTFRLSRAGRNPVEGVALENAAALAGSITATVATATTAEDTGAFMNLPAHIVAFYQERQQELAAS